MELIRDQDKAKETVAADDEEGDGEGEEGNDD